MWRTVTLEMSEGFTMTVRLNYGRAFVRVFQ